MSVIVYSSASCQPCRMTYRQLDRQGTPYTSIDIHTDPEAAGALKALGYKVVPVVVAGDTHWSGYRPDLLKALA